MTRLVAAGGGFLLAVLWFDLMFDVQVRGRSGVSEDALDSISTYYRRVTTDAHPMGRLVAVVMGVTLLGILAEIARHTLPVWMPVVSFGILTIPIILAGGHTVPNAKRLGRGGDPLDVRWHLARDIFHEHVFCFAAITALVAIQLAYG